VFLIVVAMLFVQFLAYHEVRTNDLAIQLNDPVMSALPAFDMSVAIFTITYGALLLHIYFSWRNPQMIGHLALAYGVMLILRAITLSIVPLQAPDDLIYLQDPFLNNVVYPGEIKNDLFFSGHTALLFLIYFITKKRVILVAGILLGIFLMIQRVHYSIDIIGAIPVTYLIVRIVRVLGSNLSIED
jgi:hypothetical protein